MKQCRFCLEYKDKEDFSPQRVNKDGLKSYCKPCNNLKNRLFKSSPKFKEYQRKYQINWRHGISADFYNNKFKEQNGVCELCGKLNLRGRDKFLHIDHNHITGKIRGLLCHICNTQLGRYEKTKNHCKKVLFEAYLKKYEEKI